MYERQHAHADSKQNAPHDDDHAKAHRHSSTLDAPERPVESGIVMRKARDANGVAAGAENAVAAASSSSGNALPENLMRKFEGSLGTDLSGVRVHTGAESANAADAVGARAYTVGQDIHFGAGQYDPSSGGGEHLLAHEVAHTVQQSGGPPVRQNKLEVSSPDDPQEHEADRAADAMVSGSPFSITGGSAGAARKIARERKWDWGFGAKPTVGDGFAKFAVDGSAKVEQGMSYVTVAGQLSAGGEVEVKWKKDSTGAGASGKGSAGKDGKVSQQYEMELPVWKEEAKKAAQAEAEKSWTDYFAPVEAAIVLGAEGSSKPGDEEKGKPKETKGAMSIGLKCKTKSGDSYTVKVQVFELAKKGGKVLDVSGPALKANYDKKFKSEPRDVKIGDEPAKLTVTGNIKPELTFKPNYEAIAEEIARRGAETVATEAISLAVDAAALAGPIVLAGVIIAHGIYIAGEKGARDAAIYEGAKDADQAAMTFSQIMTGSDVPGVGPRSQAAAAEARKKIAEIAARRKVTVEQLMTELRQLPASDFQRVHGPARQQAMLAYRSEVSKAISKWRKEHWFASLWTEQADDENAVMKGVEMIWNVR